MSGVVVLWIVTVVVAVGIGVLAGVLVGRTAGRRAAAPAGAHRRGPVPASSRSAADPAALAQQVVDVAPTGVVVVDRDEFVVLVNPAARRLGVVHRDRVTVPELAEVVRGLLREDDAQATTLTVEPRGPVRRGDLPTLTTLAAPVRLPGDHRTSAVALLLDDVTESRRLEDVRRDFVANVSHELKTPVGALTLLAEAVQEAADDPEAVARFAERMQKEGQRLGRLVQELIELSRLQGAEPLPGDAAVDVAAVVEEAVDGHRLAAERAGITVLARCPRTVSVRGSAAQLVTAVSNLLDNAIAYSPAGTRVGVTVSPGTDRSGTPTVRIAVSDQGIGIDEADRERVFERFYRVDPARSRATGGTGLGLAIVKHIAANHSGSVAVWSRVGSGSTFSITLPALAAVAGADDPPAAGTDGGAATTTTVPAVGAAPKGPA